MTEVWSLHILTVRDSVGVDHLDEIHVIGGNCLKGSITVQGSKNTVLPIMAASLLQREICVLRGVFLMSVIWKKSFTFWESLPGGRAMICILTAAKSVEWKLPRNIQEECVVL